MSGSKRNRLLSKGNRDLNIKADKSRDKEQRLTAAHQGKQDRSNDSNKVQLRIRAPQGYEAGPRSRQEAESASN